MGTTIFITGGARSGKSRFAEEITERFGSPLVYLATARPLDDEMAVRIATHRLRRGDAWQTVEEPLRPSLALTNCDGSCKAVLLDCLTLWLTNLLFHYDGEQEDAETRILEDVRQLTATLRSMQTTVIVVSSEVGLGIVPEHRLARRFRDIAGQANQLLAAMADEVHMVVSGIPIRIK